MSDAKKNTTLKDLLDQLDGIKTTLRGYDKEETCTYIQLVIHTMEEERKKETADLINKIELLQKEKEELTNTVSELQKCKTDLETEKITCMEEKNLLQKKYEELAEKLGKISENAIAREEELSGYHRRDKEMKEKEEALKQLEARKETEWKNLQAQFLKEAEAEKNRLLSEVAGKKNEILQGAYAERDRIIAQAVKDAENLKNRADKIGRQLKNFKQLVLPLLNYDMETPDSDSKNDQASPLREAHDRAGI